MELAGASKRTANIVEYPPRVCPADHTRGPDERAPNVRTPAVRTDAVRTRTARKPSRTAPAGRSNGRAELL